MPSSYASLKGLLMFDRRRVRPDYETEIDKLFCSVEAREGIGEPILSHIPRAAVVKRFGLLEI